MANARSPLMGFLSKPPSIASVYQGGGRSRHKIATITADVATNTILVLARFKMSDILVSAKMVMTASGGASTGDFGGYVAGDWTVADQALISGVAEDRLGTAVVMNAAVLMPGTELLEAAALTADLLYKPLWQMLGVATEPAPGTQVDLCLKVEAVDPGSMTVTVLFTYLAGD
jgi:hypothetical protein